MAGLAYFSMTGLADFFGWNALERRSQRPFRLPKGQSFYGHLQRLGLRLL